MRVWPRLRLAHNHTNKEYLWSTYHGAHVLHHRVLTTTLGTVYIFILPMTEMQPRRQVVAQGHRECGQEGEPGPRSRVALQGPPRSALPRAGWGSQHLSEGDPGAALTAKTRSSTHFKVQGHQNGGLNGPCVPVCVGKRFTAWIALPFAPLFAITKPSGCFGPLQGNSLTPLPPPARISLALSLYDFNLIAPFWDNVKRVRKLNWNCRYKNWEQERKCCHQAVFGAALWFIFVWGGVVYECAGVWCVPKPNRQLSPQFCSDIVSMWSPNA